VLIEAEQAYHYPRMAPIGEVGVGLTSNRHFRAALRFIMKNSFSKQ
jgi:hypothetical protein